MTKEVASMAESKEYRMLGKAVSNYPEVPPGTMDNISRIRPKTMPKHIDDQGRDYYLKSQADDYQIYRGHGF